MIEVRKNEGKLIRHIAKTSARALFTVPNPATTGK